MKVIATNRKARFDFEILDEYTAGIILSGSEVKSLRVNKANISGAYATEKFNEIWAQEIHIAEYKPAQRYNHEPKAARKLLLKKREIRKIIGLIKIKRMSLIVLSIFLTHKGLVKLQLGLAKGKKKYDKRESIKERDYERARQRSNKDC